MTTPDRFMGKQFDKMAAADEPLARLRAAATARTCPTCERGLIHGPGDECGLCLLDTAIARESLDWLRYADAIALAHKWFRRAEEVPSTWSGAPFTSRRARHAEALRWCETAATAAILLGEKIGEDEHQRLREIPYAALNRYNLTGEICQQVKGMLDWKLRGRS